MTGLSLFPGLNVNAKKALVTGAGGFIGSHLVEGLVREGYQVRAFLKYNSRNAWGWIDRFSPEVRQKVEIFSGDVRDPFSVRTAMLGCDLVFNLAALIGIPYSYVAPGEYVATNITGALNVAQAARDLGVERLVHTSTSEVYGTAQFVPISEEHPVIGQSPYSASKIGADQLMLSYYFSFKTPVTILRPFNTYGPRQSARAIIPTIITQIAGGSRQIKLGSLHPTRDLNFVEDTVKGFIAAGRSAKAEGKTINVGSGFEISMGDLVFLIAGLMGREVEVLLDEARVRPGASEVERLLADNRRARDLLDWSPVRKGLDGLRYGLQQTIEWFSREENLAIYKADLYNV